MVVAILYNMIIKNQKNKKTKKTKKTKKRINQNHVTQVTKFFFCHLLLHLFHLVAFFCGLFGSFGPNAAALIWLNSFGTEEANISSRTIGNKRIILIKLKTIKK